MKHIRRWLYRRGHRPAPGSIWYSPSLHLIYAMKGMFVDCESPSCNYPEPHKHGFACDRSCVVCNGHYDKKDVQ